MIHDFGEQQAGEILDNVERGLAQRAPNAAAKHPRLDLRALVERERPAVNQRRWRNRPARQPRVRTVPRVVNRRSRRAQGQLKTVGHVAAELVEGRGQDGWVPAFRAKLAEHNPRTLSEVVAINAVHFGDPIHVARPWRCPFGIAPARGLANHRAVDFIAPGQEPRATGFRRQHAAIEKLLLHVIGHAQAELGVDRQPCENVLRIAPGQRGRGALLCWIAGRERPGAVPMKFVIVA